ncbi:hypothetical protein [Streptomyces zaomyceticus]|uniref:hypothetical protein n=1 Tax=Streptomyces zaomyceticus TaxID=68286 RepID=UPI00379E85E8
MTQPPPYGPQQTPPPGWGPPPGQHYGPYGPLPPKKGMGAGAIVAIVLGSIVGLFVLIGVLGAVLGTDDKDEPRATPATRPTAAAPTSEPAAAPATRAAKPAGYRDGDYIIGEDIPPGTYQSTGAQAGVFEFCMVSTKPTADGVMPQLRSGNKDERIIITITAKDGVLSISGCEPLTRRK